MVRVLVIQELGTKALVLDLSKRFGAQVRHVLVRVELGKGNDAMHHQIAELSLPLAAAVVARSGLVGRFKPINHSVVVGVDDGGLSLGET